eukprot:CAMPEP_0177763242 /NCGR_PEP_ID=MMETSP0491_2-20121128/6768_1 /TAXON_ID=63592 /ORGANISM="Tetraselmis chuii, Strain PLY429" /LENGTH=394 /DNA_ID=CAMNT_0019279339 /DNA_START=242 /DNA_END=1426 /DNA_ORIENTATION=+
MVAPAAPNAPATGVGESSQKLAPSKFHSRVGNFFLDGDMADDELGYVLKNCGVKGWLYLNTEKTELRSKVEAAGAKWACVEVIPAALDQALTDTIIKTLDALPRPTMIQCSSATRASAALGVYLAHHGAPKGLELPCVKAAPLLKWVQSVAAPATDTTPATKVIFRQLFDLEFESNTYTYLLGDPMSKEALLIDPVLELVERDLKFVDELGLKLVYAINTHCHADHITGSGKIKSLRPEVKSGISKASGAKADIHFVHGDVVKLGALELEVRATPGHTDGCVSFYTKAAGGMVFTGDAVLIRGCGRTDFQQGSSEGLYRSVHEQVFSLPPETVLYPGHDYKGRTSSTVGEEKAHNPRLSKPLDEFVEIMANLKLPYPKKIDASLPANLVCGVQD